MPAIICGSLAFDTISVFPGRFAEHILPDKVHMLNVSFLVPQMRREFGGCAGNIAYTYRLLGGEPVVVAAIGEDGGPYLDRFTRLGIATDHVLQVLGSMTAQAYLMTDEVNNQITSFHPGAMASAHDIAVPSHFKGALAMLSPDGKQATLTHARQCVSHDIDYVLDPGQGIPMFNGEEIAGLIADAKYVIANDYEAQLISDKLGDRQLAWAERKAGAIVTRGEHGCQVWDSRRWHEVPTLKPRAIVDPTGCGDAFRGALLWALEQGHSWLDAARFGNIAGSLKISHQGGQSHSIDADQIRSTYQRHYT
jgi:adenosine kinase